jgi:MFS family permease
MTLVGVSVVDNTEGGVTTTLFPSIATTLALTTAGLGVLAALGKIVAVPVGPAWVWLSTKIGRRATLIASTVTAGLFGILAGFAQNFGMLLVFNTLLAAALVGSVPIANAVITDSFEDKDRGRAVGVFYGTSAMVAAVVSPLLALFTGISGGWRIAMWVIGGICILAGLIVAFGYREPGIGAAEKQLADLSATQRHNARVTFASVMSLFRIPTFSVMMLSRLLSGHLLVAIFGIQFLVTERGFTNAVAAIVMLPYGIGYFLGTFAGGYILAAIDRVAPKRGRVAYLQVAQVLFAVIAFFATQFHWGAGIAVYAAFWGLMGLGQGVNPPANRPLVAAVVLPELRGQAFAIWLTIFETIGWALFSIVAGSLAVALGIQEVFLFILVGLMLVNAAVLSILYVTYPRDVQSVETQLDQRRAEAILAA